MACKVATLLFLVNLLLQIAKISAIVPAIIVFGDSTVDPGNNNQISTVLKSNFQPYGRDYFDGQPTGRFSNGRIATDFVSEAFGIKPAIPAYLDPKFDIKDFATGVSFASAGTGYDNATSDVLSVIPFWKELEYYKEYQNKLRVYLGNEIANHHLSESLHLISIGTNDFLENYYIFPTRSSEYSVDEYQIFLIGIASNFIRELYKLGARKIAIGGLPPMGCLPLERTTNAFFGSECIEEYNNVAKDFNKKLEIAVSELKQELGGIQLVQSNPYDKLLEMIQNPSYFGFEYAETACCGTGLFEMSYLCDQMNPFTCLDANKYVFWDSFHPTEKTNAILADYVVKTALAQFL
ncbi:GDSL esterase/lipase At4g26790 [Durio zibethinus]|uniref:GDSL esterase/lipase At4g26790 n=1 Tax=Durio zibethinus TaxID=66656 RepID=A0A6P5WP51_DURZI|nr:GDSL esterase/lipase At4g26790 [Durio zibethinus]